MINNELKFNSGQDTKSNISILERSVKGVVNRTIFTSKDDLFSVVSVTDQKNSEIVLIGPLANLQDGQDLEAQGQWENHKEYGRRFRVSGYKTILPSSNEGIQRYLASGVVPGIGPKLAARIVEKFGTDTIRVLDKFSARLTEVSGFGKNRLKQVREAWQAQSEQREQYIFFQGLGISMAYCNRILKRYGETATKVVRENPYKLAEEVKGIGFKMADAIASHLKIAKDNPFRLGSGVVYVLQQLAEQNGHTCFPKEELMKKVGEILNVAPELGEIGLKRAIDDGAVVEIEDDQEKDRRWIYLTALYQTETSIAEFIRLRIHYEKIKKTKIKLDPTANWIQLNEAQKKAVISAFSHNISIITGGPGVGKTTVTREIVSLAQKANLKLALAAPTGRAAKRLSESSQHEAMTIHRLLKWEPERQIFAYDEHSQLKIDLIIVDEVSMLDILLAYYLLRALAMETRIVLVGDRDQLPSVGPGSFLKNLIECGQICVTHLSQVYRQSENSHIIVNAHKVNNGTIPEITSKDQNAELSDFYWIEQEEQDHILDLICKMCSQRIPDRFNFSPLKDIQVLTPMNRGLCGANHLNERLQAVINQIPPTVFNQFKFGDTTFRIKDRVMQTSNNYDLNVFNGDLGLIHYVDIKNKCFQVLFDSGIVTYGFDDANQLRLAYAITIHKSQGSEYPVVILPVIMQHYIMLQRKLIYTAMTRAAKLLILIGSKKALAMAVNNFRQTPRFTRLKEYLCR